MNSHLKIWDARLGNLRAEIKSFGSNFEVSFSGKRVAEARYDGVAIRELEGDNDDLLKSRLLDIPAKAVAISPDEKTLAIRTRNNSIELLNLKSRKRKTIADKVVGKAIAFSRDGRQIVAGGGDYRQSAPLSVWDVESAELLGQCEVGVSSTPLGNRPHIHGLEFSLDGKRVLVSSNRSIWLWDWSSGRKQEVSSSGGYGAYARGGKRIIFSGPRPGIYDLQLGAVALHLQAEATDGPVAFSPDETLVVMGDRNGLVSVFDATTGRKLQHREGHQGGVRSVVTLPGGLVASLSRADGTMRLWGPSTGKQLATFSINWDGQDVWWNEEGSDLFSIQSGDTLGTWTTGGKVNLWKVGAFEKRQMLFPEVTEKSYGASLFSMSCDGSVCAFVAQEVGRDGIRVFDMDDGSQLAHLMPFVKGGSDAWVGSISLSPDGKKLAVGCLVGSHNARPEISVQVWDVDTARKTLAIRRSTSPPGRLCFSPDGSLLATAASGKSPLEVWRVGDGQQVARFLITGDPHGRDPTPLAFSADGKWIAAGDDSNRITVWEIATQKRLYRFRGHIRPMTSVAFSLDRRFLVTGSEDGTCLLWPLGLELRKSDAVTDTQLMSYWNELASDDSVAAQAAMDLLTQSPELSVQLIRDQLTPALSKPRGEMDQLIDEVQAADAKTHLSAMLRLQNYGREAMPALLKALVKSDQMGAKKRLESALEHIRLFPIAAPDLQRSRAIQVLESIGSRAARDVVRQFADRSTQTPFAEEARQVARRMYRRAKP